MKDKELLNFPSQLRFPIGGERVTCRGSKLTNLPGKHWTTWSLDSHVINLVPRAFSPSVDVKQTISSQFFLSFELEV